MQFQAPILYKRFVYWPLSAPFSNQVFIGLSTLSRLFMTQFKATYASKHGMCSSYISTQLVYSSSPCISIADNVHRTHDLQTLLPSPFASRFIPFVSESFLPSFLSSVLPQGHMVLKSTFRGEGGTCMTWMSIYSRQSKFTLQQVE